MQAIQRKYWVFTLNNYTEEEYNNVIRDLETEGLYHVVGREVGKQGTPHLQGYVEWKKAKRFTEVKKIIERAHWEPAKGSRKHNLVYCSKEGKFIEQKKLSFKEQLRKELLDEYQDIKWKFWQETVVTMLDDEPDTRSIVWIWEETGNVGKSFLCNYMAAKYDVIICDGKKDNIFHQANMAIEEKRRPKAVILDIPRKNLDYINYGVIEQLKNRVIYSGKYEGGQLFLPKMHVFVFANQPPDRYAMSADRWVVMDLNEDNWAEPIMDLMMMT